MRGVAFPKRGLGEMPLVTRPPSAPKSAESFELPAVAERPRGRQDGVAETNPPMQVRMGGPQSTRDGRGGHGVAPLDGPARVG